MKSKYKLWIFLSFIIVFAAGVFGGILLEKYIINKINLYKTDVITSETINDLFVKGHHKGNVLSESED